MRITKDVYPVLSVVRQVEEDDARYFGPYLSAYNIKRTLNTLHDVFRFRSCALATDALNRDKPPERACLEYQIGQCNGLCVGDITQKQYIEGIEAVMRFLKGDHADAVVTLKDMMEDAANNNKFEKAAKLRDTLVYIESLDIPQVVSDTSRENTDAIGIALQNGKAQVVVLRERNGRLVEERSIALAGEADNIGAVLAELLPQYYSVETDIPDLILIQEEIEDKAILEAWLVQIREKSVEIRAPERGKKSKLLALAESNAAQKVSQQFAKWEAAAQNISTALKELREVLGSENTFKRIEGYDISHLGGTETVGSMVVLKNGKPANKEYRSFTIRTVKEGEIDDYKALKEMLGRRLKYIEKHDESISIYRLKKKERDLWAKEQKHRLEVPKDW
ncbi:MAG: UvrB/UvrC motif-containing protein, partial [Candidatus Peribacteraceae bacterium]|nr:UvrB/UvrC motif-containing protein [Candidatus Peribacteraceae bacterium]